LADDDEIVKSVIRDMHVIFLEFYKTWIIETKLLFIFCYFKSFERACWQEITFYIYTFFVNTKLN